EIEIHLPVKYQLGLVAVSISPAIPNLLKSNQRCPCSVKSSNFLSSSIANNRSSVDTAVEFDSPALPRIMLRSCCEPIISFCLALASARIKYCSAKRKTTEYCKFEPCLYLFG